MIRINSVVGMYCNMAFLVILKTYPNFFLLISDIRIFSGVSTAEFTLFLFIRVKYE